VVDLNITKVSEILLNRAYIFTCSYETAWTQWMDEDEKEQFTFNEVMRELGM